MILLCLLLAIHQVQALPAEAVPSRFACTGKSVKDFSYDCAELRARDTCENQQEDFDQCVQEASSKYFRRCSKSLAAIWCKRCDGAPQGCKSLGQKPLKKHHRGHKT